MRKTPMPTRVVFVLILATPLTAIASGGEHGASPSLWLSLAAILLIAKLGGELAVRLKQPPVLGELCAGILLGNLHLFGVHVFDGTPDLPAIAFLAELGVVLLLFEVGLESTLTEMKKVAPASGLVAIIGVIAPMALGFYAMQFYMPESSTPLKLFVGATLCATSVGITARVLKDLKAMERQETRVILGAAVIDDVLGLIVLAIVVSIAEKGQMPNGLEFASIVGLAAGFLVASLLLGAFVMPGVFRWASYLKTDGVLGAIAIGLCLLLSGLSLAAGLAAIVGAFAAGLILDEVHVRPFGKHSAHDLSEIVSPVVAVMAPVFFVRTGMMVDLGGVGLDPLLLAGILTGVAIIGKLVTGLGVRGGTADRLSVGIGMIPRGEVGLIFADAGARITRDGVPLIESGVYMAIVLMVMATTIVTPPWLARRLAKVMQGASHDGSADETAQ